TDRSRQGAVARVEGEDDRTVIPGHLVPSSLHTTVLVDDVLHTLLHHRVRWCHSRRGGRSEQRDENECGGREKGAVVVHGSGIRSVNDGVSRGSSWSAFPGGVVDHGRGCDVGAVGAYVEGFGGEDAPAARGNDQSVLELARVAVGRAEHDPGP